MKILAIAGDIDPKKLGGAEGHFVEVSKWLIVKGVQIETLKVNYPHTPNFSGLLYILFALPVAVLRVIRNRPDFIWATLDFPQAQVGAILKILTKTPLYITSQNPLLGKEELVGIGGNLVEFLVSFAFRQADCVAAVSRYSAGLATKFGARKVVVIPNGIDLAKFEIRNPKLETTAKNAKILKIITTSSLIPRNGIDTLIKACRLLKIDYELTIAGDGPERKKIEDLARGLPIQFLGRVENTKIPQLLGRSNLFVRPSRFEGFGSSFIEAMAVGLPVIGTPVGGIVDFLKDNKTGFLVSVNNPEVLAEKIEFVAKNPKLVLRISKKGQEFVKKNYNWDIIAKKVFKEMLACL